MANSNQLNFLEHSEELYNKKAVSLLVTWSQGEGGDALPGGGDRGDDGAAPAEVLREDGEGGQVGEAVTQPCEKT